MSTAAAVRPPIRPRPQPRPAPKLAAAGPVVLSDPTPAALPPPAVVEARWQPADLMAVAELGYQYLMSGGFDLAATLFEGLTQAAPREPYFALALGLTRDHQGDLDEADRCYARASELDRTDGRPDVNRAELCLERGQHDRARALLTAALHKAHTKNDEPLERKARALLARLEVRRG